MNINEVNYYNSVISNISIHKIKNGQLLLSDEETIINEDEHRDVLIEYAFSSFKYDEKYKFDNFDNQVRTNINNYFQGNSDFLDFSKKVTNILYECSNDAKRFDGDIFVIHFKNCIISGENVVDCIGIFKTEKLDYFLKTKFDGLNVYELLSDQGISMSKIDRGCLIFNTESENGYVVSVIDNRNKTNSYWYSDFLQISQIVDEYFHTQETLNVYKNFITQQLPQEFEISKIDQSDLLDKSINFFKEKEEFKYDDFVNEVLQDESVIESFSNFKSDYEQDMQISISEDFPINTQAVKKQQRHFKSIIKLDKNFHIYIHGDRKMIETGQDEKGKYYRLYFEQEK